MIDVETPFPYQIKGAEWLAPKRYAMLGDDMGLGKSCQAIRAADINGLNDILIICPANVKVNWEREFEKFSPMDRPCTVISTGRDAIPAYGVVIISYDLSVELAHLLKKRQWELLILDEAHFLKTRNAQRSYAVYGRSIRHHGIFHSAERVWPLTGTPAPNNASELWTHLHAAGITQDSFWDFTFRYCTGFESTYGFKITGHKNVDELKAMLKPYMLRRTKEQVMLELPPITYHSVIVDRAPVQLDPDFYEQVKPVGVEKFMDNLKVADQTLRQALEAVGSTHSPNDGKLGVLEAMGASMITLRRYIGMAKLPAIIDIIKDELESGAVDKIVLFGVHRCVINYACEALRKFGAVSLYGGTPPEKRQKHIDDFMNKKKCRVFVGNIQAAGVGITLTSACEVAFLEQDWVPGNNAQAAMRCHRIGQKRSVRVRVFSLYKSVDEQVQSVLMRKARELSKIF